MSFPTQPRAPHLSEADLRQALSDLDTKIQTLRNRANATAAGSPSTYQQHADALETKRAGLAEQLDQGHTPAPADGAVPDAWTHIRRGIDSLGDDLRKLL